MKDWKKIVAAVSPMLGAALGGPLGGAAGKLISQGLLGEDNASGQDIAAALMEPDNLIKLKSIERDFEMRMKELDIDQSRIGAQDRDSARDLAKDTSILPQAILSTVFIVGFFGALWLVFAGNLQLDDRQASIAHVLLGVLTSGVILILKFWFGGSPNDARQMDNVYNSIPREQLKK